MSGKKVILVLGSTGQQGGAVVRAILNDKNSEFAVRAFVRDPNAAKAQELKALGAELAVGDLQDPATVKAALQGVYGAFLVTFFWAHMSPERELAEAKMLAQACKDAGVQHVVWSTLEDTRTLSPLSDPTIPVLHEKYKVPHFDAKGESDEEFKKLGVPTTFLLTSFYYDNFISFGMGPKRGEDGKLALNLPLGQKPLPAISAEDIGKCAFGVLKAGNEFINKYVGIAGDHLTGSQFAQVFSEVLGQEVVYNCIPFEVYRKFPFPGADDISNMFQFKHDFNEQFCGPRSVENTKKIDPELQSFKTWLTQNKAAFSSL